MMGKKIVGQARRLLPGGLTQRQALPVIAMLSIPLLSGCSDAPPPAASAQVEATAAVSGAAKAPGQRYSDGWGLATGTMIPVLAAPDQNGKQRTLADLTGEAGLLLIVSRSADW